MGKINGQATRKAKVIHEEQSASNQKYKLCVFIVFSASICLPLQAIAQPVTPQEAQTIPIYSARHMDTLIKTAEITVNTQRLIDARINSEAIIGEERDRKSSQFTQSGTTINTPVQPATTWSDNKGIWRLEFPSGITCALNLSGNLVNNLCK